MRGKGTWRNLPCLAGEVLAACSRTPRLYRCTPRAMCPTGGRREPCHCGQCRLCVGGTIWERACRSLFYYLTVCEKLLRKWGWMYLRHRGAQRQHTHTARPEATRRRVSERGHRGDAVARPPRKCRHKERRSSCPRAISPGELPASLTPLWSLGKVIWDVGLEISTVGDTRREHLLCL